MAIQWFPGHMNVTKKAIAERIKDIDVEQYLQSTPAKVSANLGRHPGSLLLTCQP